MSQYRPDYMSYPPGSSPSSGLAVASMICGIVSLVLVCAWPIALPTAIVAVVLGLVAKSQIRTSQAAGQGMATAGVTSGSIALTIYGILLLCGLAALIISAVSH